MIDPESNRERQDYIESVQEKFRRAEYTDREGNRITSLLPSEIQALESILDQMEAKPSEKAFHEIALELGEDARKYVFIYFALLPLLEASTSGKIVVAVPSSSDTASAKMAMIDLRVLSRAVEIVSVEEFWPLYMQNQKARSLKNSWLICAMESSLSPPDPNNLKVSYEYVAKRHREIKSSLVGGILASPVCHKIIIYQKGKNNFLSYPPVFGARALSPCFIATAACGSPDAWEVNELRAFRDEVLLGTAWGRWANGFYYRVSPPLARWLDRKPPLQKTVRRWLVLPLAWTVRKSRRKD